MLVLGPLLVKLKKLIVDSFDCRLSCSPFPLILFFYYNLFSDIFYILLLPPADYAEKICFLN